MRRLLVLATALGALEKRFERGFGSLGGPLDYEFEMALMFEMYERRTRGGSRQLVKTRAGVAPR